MPEPDMSTPGGRVRYLFTLSGLAKESHFSKLAGLASSALSSLSEEMNTGTVRKIAKITGARAGWITAKEGDPPSEQTVKRKVKEEQERRAAKGAAA